MAGGRYSEAPTLATEPAVSCDDQTIQVVNPSLVVVHHLKYKIHHFACKIYHLQHKIHHLVVACHRVRDTMKIISF